MAIALENEMLLGVDKGEIGAVTIKGSRTRVLHDDLVRRYETLPAAWMRKSKISVGKGLPWPVPSLFRSRLREGHIRAALDSMRWF